MSTLEEHYPDLLEPAPDPDLARIITALDAMRRIATSGAISPERDHAIRVALERRSPAGRTTVVARPDPAGTRRLLGWSFHTRVVSVVTAVLVVLAGLLGYLRLQPSAHASAATILHHAALALTPPPAGEVVHEITVDTDRFLISPNPTMTAPFTYVTTTEQWSRYAAGGTVDRFDLRITANGSLVERSVLNAQDSWFYDARQNRAIKDPPVDQQPGTPADGVIWPKAIMTEPQNPAASRSFLLAAAGSPNTQLLPQQSLDGKPVDVVRVTKVKPSVVNGAPVPYSPDLDAKEVFTLYIDASTYAVVRIDQEDTNAHGETIDTSNLRVTTNETVPASKVPPDVFSFTSPPGAQVQNCLATESCVPGPVPNPR